MPPNASHGVAVCRLASAWLAWSAGIGVGPLPPSMYTSPARSRAPGRPLKSQVA